MTSLMRCSDGALRAGWRLGLFLLGLAIGGGFLGTLFYLLHFPPQKVRGVVQPLPLLGTGIGIVAIVLAITWLVLRRLEHRTFPTIGLPGGAAWRAGVPVGVALGMVVPVVVTLILWAVGRARIEAVHVSASDLAHATVPMVAATALLSSWEEIVYRGYPLQLLNQIGGVWFGTILTGAAFGLSHAGNPGANPIGLANTALNGMLLGAVVVRTGSLWLACGYHAGWNLAAAQLLGLRDSGVISPGSCFTTTLTGPSWLSGGNYGFEGSLLTGAAETVLLATMLALAGRLPGVPAARPYFAGTADTSNGLAPAAT
jgi:CAAX protease family protein